MKKYVCILFVVLFVFAFSSSLYAQMIKLGDGTKTEKSEKSEKSEDSGKEETRSSGCCGDSSSFVDYTGYEDDPLYKEMKELQKKMQEEYKKAAAKAKEIQEKYGDVKDLAPEERSEMFKEIMEAYTEYNTVSAKFREVKAKLDAKIEKDMAEKYKDDPLYQAMAEAKKKMDAAYAKYLEESKKLCGEYSTEMTDEQIKEYKEKMMELAKPYKEAQTEYYKARKAFYESIKTDKAEGEDNGEEKE